MSSHLELFAQLTANGVAVGSIYALVALGIVLIHKATEVLNFAHGDLLVVAAFSAWALIDKAGLSFWLVLPLVALAMGVLAYGIDALVVRRIVGQPQFAGVMLTIAIAFMMRGLVSMGFGTESQSYDTPWTGSSTEILGITVADLSLVIMGSVLLIAALLWLFFRYTRLGIAMQAASQNQLAAHLNGVRVKRVNSLVWALAGVTAAVAGIFLAPITLVDTSLWLITLKALAAIVLGGFGSLPGAVIGGILIGLIEQYAGVYLMHGVKDIAAYLVLILVLILRPTGIMGEAHGRRV
ncbi:branched-chain amino acid ABC transporter permease [Pararhodobacter aggregans]|uniref:Branched-chain amino acid ABC transporter permease n=1 Tax=Pararhodobacter aggregans TaxID=404875 RepID=A0A2T7UUY0_9RHOB|nr:branched-chain amino acid ABC transporter permease [Pararhodobacter aggregans]PTX04155.1 amino acid/amide ABC transporter membrane protein 1 (HAAT family) [Pararhodobacter aggregans]PVE48388.1 branched-chain amino acid ABC transporter permease [Pararhodobacter aggregans]